MISQYENCKFIACLYEDLSISWVHNLTENKILVVSNETFDLYKFDRCYFLYYKNNASRFINFIEQIVKKNYLHWIITDFNNVDIILTIIDNINLPNFNYSILNHMGEFSTETSPRKIIELKNYKFYFSCCDLIKIEPNHMNSISEIQNKNNFILDYRYSLVYFYFKYGWNFYERGELSDFFFNKIDGIFLYGKSKGREWRKKFIDKLNLIDCVRNKEFDNEEIFWFTKNNHASHSTFMIDYNKYKFNFIFETQPPFDDGNIMSNFITEKTLKSLLITSPSYVLLRKKTYDFLNKCGFYFLNSEFGEYNLENYEIFCRFFIGCTHSEFDRLYEKTSEKTKKNKILLENYIFSTKEKELKLLLNEL